MPSLLWVLAGAAILIVAVWGGVRRQGRTRQLVLEEVRRRLRGGTIEPLPSRGPQARGRLGELEVTVDLHHDARAQESKSWRVMAVGPVHVADAVEAHVGDWRGWIDPWMQKESALSVPASGGPPFTVHARQPLTMDHPVIAALRRQGPALGSGGLHVQRDFMRAEVRFDPHPENNRSLFGFLDAMAEISSLQPSRSVVDRRVRVNVARETG
ncbi:MAG: hypothetical protein E6K80_13780 [Candidatus Eisenbacteria bacterium]|uniref:Uncharacterized protein n=1 Tax=Eiseniibacteriota bacterium TaxID=2212470 RepID=A0A538TYV0_UNCEI|nr:MAG: hypothetical protein E6K80_13780 [Candidatus Eisenbacteria bacterium]